MLRPPLTWFALTSDGRTDFFAAYGPVAALGALFADSLAGLRRTS